MVVAGCANDAGGFATLPPAPVVEFYLSADDSPPVCVHAVEYLDAGDPSMGVLPTKRCVWTCAYYWTHDGRLGPRRYERTWMRFADGWGGYDGQFWYSCNESEPP